MSGMISKTGNILQTIVDAITIWLNYLIHKNKIKEKKEKQIEKQESNLEKKNQEIDNAIYNHDTKKINEIINSSLVILLMLSVTLLSGCFTNKVIYVPSDREVKELEYQGVHGYFVPDATMSDLLKSKNKCKFYERKYGPIITD